MASQRAELVIAFQRLSLSPQRAGAMPVLSGGMGQKCPIAIWSLPHSRKNLEILAHSELSVQKNVRSVSKTVHFYTLPLVAGIMVDECEHILVLALITAIMVDVLSVYSGDFRGLPHSEIMVCPIALSRKSGFAP